MALTKESLTALGIESEKADQIIKAYTEEINVLKTERDSYKTNADKLNKVQKQLDEANKKLTESEDFKTQLETLKGEISAKETAEKKSGALRKILRDKGYSENGIEKIVKYGGFTDEIEFDENGAVKDSDGLITAIDKEWSEYTPTTTTSYTEPSNPPKDNNTSSSKPEIAQYVADYYNRLYGEKKED
ncbi:MAG: hypothetical protein K2J47_11120 [Ruminococcus sp.]|nr:hypothetical protein [Ruminococcus sp.]